MWPDSRLIQGDLPKWGILERPDFTMAEQIVVDIDSALQDLSVEDQAKVRKALNTRLSKIISSYVGVAWTWPLWPAINHGTAHFFWPFLGEQTLGHSFLTRIEHQGTAWYTVLFSRMKLAHSIYIPLAIITLLVVNRKWKV